MTGSPELQIPSFDDNGFTVTYRFSTANENGFD